MTIILINLFDVTETIVKELNKHMSNSSPIIIISALKKYYYIIGYLEQLNKINSQFK